MDRPLVRLRGITREYVVGDISVRALRGIDLEIALQRSAGLPQRGLRMGLDSGWSSATAGAFAYQLGGGVDAWTTVSLDVPIYDRSATHDAVSRARLASREKELELEDARQEVGIQVCAALAARDAARAQREAAEAQLVAAEAGLGLVTDRYEAGSALLVEVTASQASVTEAARSEARARWSERLYEYALAYVVGGP